jgi:hypothetical protein
MRQQNDSLLSFCNHKFQEKPAILASKAFQLRPICTT